MITNIGITSYIGGETNRQINELEALNLQLAKALEEFVEASVDRISLPLFKRNAARALISKVKA